MVVAAPVFYVASFGPAWWLVSRYPKKIPISGFVSAYLPIYAIGRYAPRPIGESILWYAAVGAPDRSVVTPLHVIPFQSQKYAFMRK